MNKLVFVFLFCLLNCIKDYQVNYLIKNRLEVQKKTIGISIGSDINDILCEILKGNEENSVENFYNLTFKNTVLELIKQDFLDLGLFKPFSDCTESNKSVGSGCGKTETDDNKPDIILDANISLDKSKKFFITVRILDQNRKVIKNKNGDDLIAINNEYSPESFHDTNPNVKGLRKISIELFKKMNLISKKEEAEILNGSVETSCLRAASEFYRGKQNEAFFEQIQKKIQPSTGINNLEKNKISSFIRKFKEKEAIEKKRLERNYGDSFRLEYTNLYKPVNFSEKFNINKLLIFFASTKIEDDITFDEMIKKIDSKDNYKKANLISLEECLGEKTRYLKAEANLNNLSPLLPPIGI